MNWINILMQAGTFLAALATLPQLVAVFKNRDQLKGYDPLASFGLFMAMVCFSAAFVLMDNWVSVACEVPVAIFWLLAAYYSWKGKGGHAKYSQRIWNWIERHILGE